MNQQAMLRKARQLQQEMLKAQQEIEETEFKASAGGIVTVVYKGNKELVKVIIAENFEVESKEDLEMLSASIVAASNQAYQAIEKMTEEKLGKYQSMFGGML